MFEIVRSPLVGSRLDLAGLCNQKNIRTVAEIGTDRVVFVVEFLERWIGELLYCVDDYRSYMDLPWNRQGDMLLAVTALARFQRRVRLIKATSIEFAQFIQSNPKLPGLPLGFVYIDADHSYEATKHDANFIAPHMGPNGIMAFHDSTTFPGVACGTIAPHHVRMSTS